MNTSRKDSNNDREYGADKGTTKAPGRPSFNLEFVNMRPTSQAEKQMNEKVIRSKAMRSYRQKKQMQRTKDEEARTRNRERAVQPRSCPNNNHSGTDLQRPETSPSWTSEVDFSDSSWLVRASHPRNLRGIDSGFEASPRSASPFSNNSDLDPIALGELPQSNALTDLNSGDFTPTISPITPLGAGRIDPFRMSSSDTGLNMHELIDHCRSPLRSNGDFWLLISIDHC